MKNITSKKIFISSDHAGYDLKELILQEFSKLNISIVDLGCDSAEKSVDYPDFAKKLSKEIKAESDFGILVCGSGIGISIAANRFKHIRAALCHNAKSAKLSRQHNNANVICLGSRLTPEKTALNCIKTFLNTEFEDGRHAKRVKKLST